MRFSLILTLSFMFFGSLYGEEFTLRDNMKKAKPGDYLVILTNKTQTLMHIADKRDNVLTIEEIAVPEGRKPANITWKQWVSQNGPGNTSWVIYEIDLNNGAMLNYFSFTKNNWFDIPEADNLLSKLLNLKLYKIAEKDRKKVGPKPCSGPDLRSLWQPRMIIDGKVINGVLFNAWQTKWPKDSSELSGKTIEIYLPQESERYPAYFPYWLQINGSIGKAKVRVIDSGTNLISPKKNVEIKSSSTYQQF